MEKESRQQRVRSVESAAIAGVVYAVLAVVALTLLTRHPDLMSSDAEIAAWYDESSNRTTLILGLTLATISAVAFLWFVAVIRRRMGDREDRFFATVFLGSAILYIAIWLIGAATLASPAVAQEILDGGSINRSTATFAGGFAGALYLVAGPRIQAVFVLTTSTLILRTGVLPRWLAYLGFTMGILLFTIPLIIQPIGFGFPLWVFIVSVTILVTRSADHR